MPLGNTITKFTLLVDEAQYPAAMKERVIRDTLISGIPVRKLVTRSLGKVEM